MELITVSSRGQIVIPESVRERLGIEKGTKLILHESNGVLTLYDAKKVEALLEEEQEIEAWKRASSDSMKDIWQDENDAEWEQYL